MNCETFTYSAHETDYSVARAAGPYEALVPAPRGALSAAPVPLAVLKLLMWMRWYVSGVLETFAAPKLSASQPSHIFRLPSTNPAVPARCVRVNRSMLRKLRRIQRLRPQDFDGTAYRPAGTRPDLSNSQYLEWMIRKYKWNRVRIHRLGGRRSVALFKCLTARKFRGNSACVGRALLCHAPISPD